MPDRQLSLWDNVALESGYRCMAGLELEEAQRGFNEALRSAVSSPSHSALRHHQVAGFCSACQYFTHDFCF